MIIELDGFSGSKLYIFVSHISGITDNGAGKGAQIFVDSSETPFTVTEDVETVLEKIRDSMAQARQEDTPWNQ